MDIESGNKTHTPVVKLECKPIVSEHSETKSQLYYGLHNNSISLVDVQKHTILHHLPSVHQNRIGCIRNKNNLLITGGCDNFVRLFDSRSFDTIHNFQRIPSKFTSLDISEHILAGATGSNIVFWDLRKMKQRSQFKDSFNEDVTYIRFEDQITTNLLGCSVDGMINMFDLTQPNEEDAFSWCYKVMESPGFLSTSTQGRILAQTLDHHLYKIQEGDQLGKISPNNAQNPKHIIYCQFEPNYKYEVYGYFTWSPQQKVVEHWMGNFSDKSNAQKCMGYLTDVEDIQLFNLMQSQAKTIGIYADEKGNIFTQTFSSELKIRSHHSQPQQNKNQKKWNFGRKDNVSKSQQKPNRNGYVLQKPPSSFGKHKKFNPY